MGIRHGALTTASVPMLPWLVSTLAAQTAKPPAKGQRLCLVPHTCRFLNGVVRVSKLGSEVMRKLRASVGQKRIVVRIFQRQLFAEAVRYAFTLIHSLAISFLSKTHD